MERPEMAATAATSTILAFITLLPLPNQILATESEDADHIRINEFAAGAVSLGVGLLLSIVSRETEPFVIALVTSAALVGAVEYLTRKSDNERSANVRPSYL